MNSIQATSTKINDSSYHPETNTQENIQVTNQPEALKESTSIDGQVIGTYKIIKTIGQGTYGKVKLAHHTLTGAKVYKTNPVRYKNN